MSKKKIIDNKRFTAYYKQDIYNEIIQKEALASSYAKHIGKRSTVIVEGEMNLCIDELSNHLRIPRFYAEEFFTSRAKRKINKRK